MWDNSIQEAQRLREEALKNKPQESTQEDVIQESQPQDNVEAPVEESVETPTETQVQDSSLDGNSEATIEQPEAKQEPKQEVDFDELFKKRVEEEGYIPKSKYEEDLSSRMEVKSDFIKRLVELQNEGVDINEGFLTSYFEDLDRYDVKKPSDLKDVLIRQKLSDGYTKEDAELIVSSEFEDLFSGDSDYESIEFKVQRAKAETQARKFIEKLKQDKEKLAIPKEFGGGDSVEAYKKQQEKLSLEQQQNVANYLNEVAKNVDTKLNKLELDIRGEKVSYEVPSETKEKVKQAVKDYSSFLDKNFVSDKGLDQEKLFEFFTFYFDRDKIHDTISGRFKSSGREEVVEKDIKNSNFKPKEVSSGNNNNKSNLDKIPASLRSFINKN